MNETECRNIGTVEMLEEERLTMKSVDGEVLAAGEPRVSGKRDRGGGANPLTCTRGSFFGQMTSSVSGSSFHCERRFDRMPRCADDLRMD